MLDGRFNIALLRGADRMHRSATDLTDAIEQATRLAVQRLFAEHPKDFYYVSLITSGEAHAPFLTAWSKEALARETVSQGLASSAILKWSYADSPYNCYGEEFFDEVRRLFNERPQWHNERTGFDWAAEFDFRLAAMQVAVQRLSGQGQFGTGCPRRAKSNTRVRCFRDFRSLFLLAV